MISTRSRAAARHEGPQTRSGSKLTVFAKRFKRYPRRCFNAENFVVIKAMSRSEIQSRCQSKSIVSSKPRSRRMMQYLRLLLAASSNSKSTPISVERSSIGGSGVDILDAHKTPMGRFFCTYQAEQFPLSLAAGEPHVHLPTLEFRRGYGWYTYVITCFNLMSQFFTRTEIEMGSYWNEM